MYMNSMMMMMKMGAFSDPNTFSTVPVLKVFETKKHFFSVMAFLTMMKMTMGVFRDPVEHPMQ